MNDGKQRRPARLRPRADGGEDLGGDAPVERRLLDPDAGGVDDRGHLADGRSLAEPEDAGLAAVAARGHDRVSRGNGVIALARTRRP
jgi:hypothetical protein